MLRLSPTRVHRGLRRAAGGRRGPAGARWAAGGREEPARLPRQLARPRAPLRPPPRQCDLGWTFDLCGPMFSLVQRLWWSFLQSLLRHRGQRRWRPLRRRRSFGVGSVVPFEVNLEKLPKGPRTCGGRAEAAPCSFPRRARVLLTLPPWGNRGDGPPPRP